MAESSFAVDEHALMVAKIAELVRFDFVFLDFVVIHIALACTEAPRAFDDALLAEKIGSLDGVGFIGGAEDHAIAEIQRQHFGFIVSERRHE